MSRCALSQSVSKLPMLGQLLWHRLIHDGGVDEWGIAHGAARTVYASCLAATVDCTVQVVEELE